MSRADRIFALDHLGLPQGFHPSRASSLKLAETLDADSQSLLAATSPMAPASSPRRSWWMCRI
jgi:hypothetical protein